MIYLLSQSEEVCCFYFFFYHSKRNTMAVNRQKTGACSSPAQILTFFFLVADAMNWIFTVAVKKINFCFFVIFLDSVFVFITWTKPRVITGTKPRVYILGKIYRGNDKMVGRILFGKKNELKKKKK